MYIINNRVEETITKYEIEIEIKTDTKYDVSPE
jgi:hypothetical protein